MPKREFPVLMVLSMLILLCFFIFMRQAFRASINIDGVVNNSLSARGNDGEVHFADQLFERDLKRHVLQEKKDKREIVDYTEEPTLGKRLKQLLNCTDFPLFTEKVQYGSYWLIRNFVRGTISTSVGCADTITLTTNGDYTFFEYLPFLIECWQAPISFAVYSPGYDFNSTMDSIQYARNCIPQGSLIQDYVTFHIYFPTTDMPEYVPLNEEEALLWPYECGALAPYINVNRSKMYKVVKNMTYPINVGRNIARKSVNTYFIFATDMELYPTTNLTQKFLEMIERNRTVYLDRTTERVFVLPIFEVTKESKIPKGKTQLVDMLHKKKALPFHAMICRNCHLVPKENEWINASDSEELTLFSHTKRDGKFQHWEPFYISDNQEPLFDERVTWEGQSNKRIQNYAMCLLQYDYFVLHPAFLVHTPGIKYFDKNATRLKYVPDMNKLIKNVIQPEYEILYGKNNRCST